MSGSKPFATVPISIRLARTRRSWRSRGPVRTMLDSGSSVSILSTSVAQAAQEKLGSVDSFPVKLKTVNGEKPASALRGLTLCLGRTCIRGDLVVTDGFDGDVLIGGDFLLKGRCRIDFARQRLVCGNDRVRFRMEA